MTGYEFQDLADWVAYKCEIDFWLAFFLAIGLIIIICEGWEILKRRRNGWTDKSG